VYRDDNLYGSSFGRSCGNSERADGDGAEGSVDYRDIAEEVSGGEVGGEAMGERWRYMV